MWQLQVRRVLFRLADETISAAVAGRANDFAHCMLIFGDQAVELLKSPINIGLALNTAMMEVINNHGVVFMRDQLLKLRLGRKMNLRGRDIRHCGLSGSLPPLNDAIEMGEDLSPRLRVPLQESPGLYELLSFNAQLSMSKSISEHPEPGVLVLY